MVAKTILIVDDEVYFLRMLEETLRKDGYVVISATDGVEALRKLYNEHPDLVMLDVQLPTHMDGYSICRRIREVSSVPVIMLTGQSKPEDIVEGFDAGADDYITKPYHRDVLLARVRANLYRAQSQVGFDRTGVVYKDSYLTVNVDERRVNRGGEQIKFSPIEFKLLINLIEAAPSVVPYKNLLQNVWGDEYVDDIDYLRVYIMHLRRKIEQDPKNPVYIATEHGFGYHFEMQS